MSGLDRALGLARSLAIYRAIPFRARRMRNLYAQFVKPGDLVFDVGGHVGNRTAAFAALGCRVIVLEPQPDFARLLRRRFSRCETVRVIEAAALDKPGRAELTISDRTPTVSTLASDWREERAQEPGFSTVRWNRSTVVDTTTLDQLIARHGIPAFIKIDVEGGEPQVLAGLSHPVRGLSFEYMPGDVDRARRCVERLERVARYRFNWSVGETSRLSSKEWIPGEGLISMLEAPTMQRRSGDVYTRASL